MFIFPLLSRCHTVPRISCPYKSNGDLGYLQYVVQDKENKPDQYKSNRYTSMHHEGNKYDYNWIAGSICPRKTGTYTIKATGYPAIVSSFNGLGCDENVGDKCTGKKEIEHESQYLYANRCYPIAIADYTNCVSGVYLNGYINGKLIDNNSVIITNCFTQDCIKGYATDTCALWNDAYCNGNGEPDWGRSSDGLGCICTSYGNNYFCENTNNNAFTNQGVTSSFIVGSSINETIRADHFDNVPLDFIYGTYQIKARLNIPQNTYLEFAIVSNPEVQMYINDKFVCGATSLQDIYDCTQKKAVNYQSSKEYYKRGTYNVVINMNVGCSMTTRELKVMWKFYRWYKNNPPGFETIPKRYLGTA
jgi:hypothetical protein